MEFGVVEGFEGEVGFGGVSGGVVEGFVLAEVGKEGGEGPARVGD